MKHLLFLVLALTVVACIPKITKLQLQETDIERLETEKSNVCGSVGNYYPDSLTPMRYVRVNVHIMRDSAGLGNFSEEEGAIYAKELIAESNKRLSHNRKMNLPKGNNTEVLQTQLRFVITPQADREGDDGIYFHNDNDLYHYLDRGKGRNFTSKAVYEKYGIGKGEILNVFIQAHHRDTVTSIYRKGELNMKGIAFPSDGFVKVTGLFHYSTDTMYYKKETNEPVIKGAWFCAGHINHEIGHVLGLHHTWSYNDGCDDTPKNPNCWAYNKKPPCNESNSNNVMDYNTYQTAWSPCQLGKVHRNFSTESSKTRRLLQPTWCAYNSDKTIRLYDDQTWDIAKDIEGDIIVGNAAVLTINCKVNMAKGAKIIVKQRGKLVLNGATIQNACGETWKGIEIWDDKKTKGKVIYQNNPTVKDTEVKTNIKAN